MHINQIYSNEYENVNDIYLHMCHLHWQGLVYEFQTLEEYTELLDAGDAKRAEVEEKIRSIKELLDS